MQAYLYFFDITTLNDFWIYFMDYAIYGQIYGILGWDAGFYEIDFAPADILCYELNDFATDSSDVPTYSQTSLADVAGVSCDTAASIDDRRR